ncbi:MAG: hypothetical protein M3P51_04800, partial [Chloroflexota bacterium]|nr:hypothetical protein [Chloroflexota bacterium]
MGSYMHARNAIAWALLASLVIFAAVMGSCLGRRGSQPSQPDRVLVQFPTAIPAPTPTPLPTRDPIQAKPQDEAGSRALRFLSEVAGGGDPYFYQGALGSSIRIVVCPYGCDRAPRLTRFSPNPVT